jgi:hypothetical protein
MTSASRSLRSIAGFETATPTTRTSRCQVAHRVGAVLGLRCRLLCHRPPLADRCGGGQWPLVVLRHPVAEDEKQAIGYGSRLVP